MRTDLRNILVGGAEAQDHAVLTDVGAVTKTDGHDGQVLVKILPSADPDEVFEDDFLYLLVDGEPVPKRVIECKRRGERSATVRLANVPTLAEAERLVGCRVMAMSSADDDDDFDEEGIVGYTAIDQSRGILGVIDDFDDRVAANPLLVLSGPYGELLIPAVDDFIIEVDDVRREVLLNLPDGLLDINNGDNSDVD